MIKINKTLIVYIVLIVIFVGGVVSIFSNSGYKSARVTPPGADRELRDLMSVQEDELDVSSKGSTRNPFVISYVKEESGFKFLGIFWGSETPSVIINNKVYGLGDAVDGMKITEIKDGELVLTDESGAQKIFSLKENAPVTEPKLEDNATAQADQKNPNRLPLNKRKPNQLPRSLNPADFVPANELAPK